MKTTRLSGPFLRLLAPLILSLPVVANTWIVDDDGGTGVHFTTIQKAVLAAQHGDEILVHPGAYPAFNVTKALKIVGLAPGVEAASANLHSLPAPRQMRLANMGLSYLVVNGNGGTILAQDLHVDRVYVDDCSDVRFRGFVSNTVEVDNSHVELVQSMIAGTHGSYCSSDWTCCGGDGDDAVTIEGTSEVHIAHCTLFGGYGGDCTYAYHQYGGNGGHGLIVGVHSTAIVTGVPSDLIDGGGGGLGGGGPGSDGFDGHGILNNGTLRVSGVTVQDLDNNGILDTPTPPDASLSAVNEARGGQVVHLTVHGPASANVRMLIGRTPRFKTTPGVLTELMVAPLRWVPLGRIGASGELDYDFIIPPGIPPGYLLIAQALVVDSTGTSRTNSVTTIVR